MQREDVATPEQMLMRAIEVIRQRAEPDDEAMAREPAEWELDTEEVENNPHMEEIHFAEFAHYILYVSVAKDLAVRRMPPGTSKRSWSIYTMPQNEAITGGSADSVEQGKRFAEIAYRAMFGVVYRGDA